MINSENKKEPFHASFDIEFSAFEKEFGEHFYFKKNKTKQKKIAYLRGLSTDSRVVCKEDLFIALKGKNFDGHNFVQKAKEKGATAAVVELNGDNINLKNLVNEEFFLICVSDTSSFLRKFASWHRRKFQPKVILIVGSNGKTTTKAMLHKIFSSKYKDDELVVTFENHNNHIGVPLTLLNITKKTKVTLVELGMNDIGEIEPLAKLVKPNVVVITNAQRDHQEFVGSVEKTAYENGTAIKAIKEGGVVIFPDEQDFVKIWSDFAKERKIESLRFNVLERSVIKKTSENTNYQFAFIKSFYPLVIEITDRNKKDNMTLTLKGFGKHFALNALASFTAAKVLDIPNNFIKGSLTNFLPVKGRGSKLTIGKNLYLLDDTYNANPDSMIAGLHALQTVPGDYCAVLGDMGELGASSKKWHREVLNKAKNTADLVLLVGENFTKASESLGFGFICKNRATILNELKNWVIAKRNIDLDKPLTIYMKGSRSMALDEIIKILIKGHLE
jgi:murE/murF fusion protein